MAEDGFEVIVSQDEPSVSVSGDEIQVYVTEEVISVVSIGTQGPAGPANETYTHTQSVASDTWVIEHNLGKHPSVVVIDSAGSVIISDVQYDSAYQVTVTFSASFSGKAYLN